ncbi:hypothetical protein SAMN04488117_102343 [Celeribacter baekdonensis]|uniref:Uncharacterized protein n=1 Tax=Celeribacter baekdonensis TaxID=875171 RepID=A0A1G7IID6_9RHOB|nr:hypothetical protein SAMN04488117_102343 [Celeribacter baekdonensis]
MKSRPKLQEENGPLVGFFRFATICGGLAYGKGHRGRGRQMRGHSAAVYLVFLKYIFDLD